MDAELQSAVSEYRSQLVAVEELLAGDPDNAEVKEVYDQLQGALQYTLTALSQLDDNERPEGGADGGDGGTGEAVPTDAADAAASEGAAGSALGLGPLRPRGGAPNNARIHPANRYHLQEPDFGALAEQYDDLRPYVTVDAGGRARFDTTSWAATRALTAALLAHDFGLRWGLPEGQLVPPVTNRANYIHWINDLLQLSSPTGGGPIRGLDIGCGANFIYCLLGAVLYGWTMVGVDVTQVAVQCCQKLIQDNPELAPLLEVRDLSRLHPELQTPQAAVPLAAAGDTGSRRGRKRPTPGQDPGDDPGAEPGPEPVGHTDPESGQAGPAEAAEAVEAAGGGQDVAAGDVAGGGQGAEAAEELEDIDRGILLPVFQDHDDETFAFTMCNPPFFESMQEAAKNPHTAFGGTAAEMVCPGGELAFVLRMLVDSESLQDRVHWFSTMVGKKSTLKALKRELHSRHVTALRSTELAQGKTSRWAVAWSWQVDPNKASQPLSRPDPAAAFAAAATGPVRGDARAEAAGDTGVGGGGAPAGRSRPGPGPSLVGAGVPVLPRRHVSFTVRQSGALTSRTVLQDVRRLLEERGCSPLQVDCAAWTVAWPLQVGPFAASGGAQGASGANTEEPLASGGGGGNWAANITVRLRIAQQQRGRLEVVATLPTSAPDAAARAFATLMASLQAALGGTTSS